jgi:G3E family GTPase
MQPHYKDVLNIQATLTLLDLRKLENDKWRNHSTFREQVQIADAIVVTKSDLYSENLTSDLQDYLKELKINNTPVVTANKGELDIAHLENTCKFNQTGEANHHHHHHGHDNKTTLLSAPATGVLKVVNQGEGYFSRGWLCSKNTFFDFQQCQNLFDGLKVERLKAVINTDKGAFGFNIVDGQLYVTPIDEAEDSRIELITSDSENADAISVEIEQELNLM